MPVHPIGRLRPLEGKVDNGPRRPDVPEGSERRAKHRALGHDIVRLTEWAAERELDRRDSRCSPGRRQVRNHRESDRADARLFDTPLRQSDGPAADRSDGDEDGEIHALSPHLLDDCWDRDIEKLGRIQEVPHE